MMSDSPLPGATPDVQAMEGEIIRLNKVVQALMNRSESATNAQGSSYGLFQTTIMLQEQVRRRTEELEAALRENESITRSLRESEARFHGLVSQSLVGIAIVEDARLSYANPKFAEIFGYGVDEICDLRPLELATEDDRPLVAEQMRRRLSGEVAESDYVFRGLRKDGTAVDIEVHASGMEIGEKLAPILLVLDITERMRAERQVQALQAQLSEQAIRDPLTDLYNRRYLEEAFARELARAERSAQPVSVVMADLDHFKSVNDSLGHQAGDEVLVLFGDLLRRHARGSDLPCRWGGEEFVLILLDMTHASACERAENLRSALADSNLTCEGAVIRVTASFGVATFPRHGGTSDELIAAADGALFAAKHAGRNQVKSCEDRGES
jgi:diguanylate cyclase (GGDEF)-like protein/PAS domain S-box-containing protein